MNFKTILFALAAVLTLAACQQQGSSRSEDLKTESDSASYAIGVLVGNQNKQQLKSTPDSGQNFNLDLLAIAFEKQLKGEETKMTSEQANTFIQGYFKKLSAKEGSKNKEEGEAYLTKNKEKEGVKTTASGLQYEIIKEGTGPKPKADDQVKVDYTGTTIDGKVFDSSVQRGKPATFGVGQVIPGWTEALQLMPVGSKWKIYIPSNLAYGERGAGKDIGPNSTLIFEVELLDIVKDQKKK